VPVHVNIEEVRKPEIDAQLIADSISQQLAKRIMFRRAMKRAITNAMRLGAQGIKIMSAGRLNGIEIARTEWYREGRVPLHTMRAEIDYGVSEAKTSYGVIGIKVWVFKGEVMHKSEQPAAAVAAALAAPPPAPEKPAPAAAPVGKDKAKKPRAPRKAPAKSGAKNAATRKA
jgi:small subunit ribosomal protein S3